MGLTKHLPNATRLTIPAAMVLFLTIEITKSQGFSGWVVYVVTVAAFTSSVGIELWGITAGDNLKKAWSQNSGKISTAIQMVAYVCVAGWMLRTNETLFVLPLVAALAYVASAWADGYRETAAAVTTNAEFEREQAAKDREVDRQVRLKQADANKEVRLAKVEVKAAGNVRQESGRIPADWRQLTRQQRRELAHATREEREGLFPEIAPRTRRDWHERLDKIAAQNGGYVAQ